MKIIHRYIIRETLSPFIAGTIFFTFVLIIDRVRNLVELTVEKSIPMRVTLELFTYMLPFTGALSIPMGVLFGILFAFGRLSSNSEIISMRASGISIYYIFKPAFYFGLVSTFGMFLFINFVMPETNHRYKLLYRNILYANPSIALQNRVFTDIPIPQNPMKISAMDTSSDGNTMKSVFLCEFSEKEDQIRIIYGERGEWISNDLNSPLTRLVLRNGMGLLVNLKNPEETQSLQFDTIFRNILKKNTPFGTTNRGLREINVFEIRKKIKERKESKRPIYPTLYVEYHKKFSLPVACFVFVLVGMPLGITFHRSGKGLSLGVAVIIIFVYYFFMTFGEYLGENRYIHAAMSMWIPNIAIFAVGAFIFWLRARE